MLIFGLFQPIASVWLQFDSLEDIKNRTDSRMASKEDELYQHENGMPQKTWIKALYKFVTFLHNKDLRYEIAVNLELVGTPNTFSCHSISFLLSNQSKKY
ncbi:hypothetical protein GWI33_004188 [Rhynchophorus ferrugineus]|uniref:Uncharacterized protein n=1 Tax=Rhynchophorus ferrugineus TaxID=354439 RepID=A0A834IYY9_RHYFE|nr:hypothetical protein GWI33_004188 [Rhynchophorus ferrugineus]